jgi:hypothetical protein
MYNEKKIKNKTSFSMNNYLLKIQFYIFLSVILLTFNSCQVDQSPCSDVPTNLLPPPESIKIDLWPNGHLTYYIPSTFNESEKQNIRAAMNSWEDKTKTIVFSEVDENSAKLRFIKSITGCSSGLGITSNGTTDVSLSNTCDLISYKHELGHSIGLIHEHQRAERKNNLIFPQNTYDYIIKNFPERTINLVLYNLNEEVPNYNDPFQFDFSSIMIYGSYPRNAEELKVALQGNNLPLFRMKSNCNLVERPTDISEKDVKLVQLLYPRYLDFQNSTENSYVFTVRMEGGRNIVYRFPPGGYIRCQYNFTNKCFMHSDNKITSIDLNNGASSDDITFNSQSISYTSAWHNQSIIFNAIEKASSTIIANSTVNDSDGIDGNNLKLQASKNGNHLIIEVKNANSN